jgi:predicted unusual protein kinase regulating ubiquinone biosynthesis (AarF/ABC1/UbiB family)
MEYIRGKTIFNIEKEDYDLYAKQIMKFCFITNFMHGVVHGDLHIGNILFIKDEKDVKYKNKICILDFGIIYEIGETRNTLFDILTDMCSTSPEILAKKILYSGLIEPLDVIKSLPIEHYNSMIKIIMVFVNVTIHIDKRFHQINIYKFLKDLNHYINNNDINGLKLKANDDLVKIQVIFGMLHGVILTLLGEKNYIQFADNVINETFHLDLLKN